MAEKKEKGKFQRTEIKEFGRAAALEKLFEKTDFRNGEVQMLSGEVTSASSDGKKITTTIYNYMTCSKIMLEGIDFDLTYTPIKYLGYKAAIYAIGSLYAHCYSPYILSFNIAVSGKFSYENVEWLWAGIQAAAKEHRVFNVTMDLSSSLTGLSISCTAIGRQEKNITDAFPKVDSNALVCVTGNLGAAYMGLHVLEREKVAFSKIPPEKMAEYKQPDFSKYKYLLGQYLTPEVPANSVDKFKEAGFFPAGGYFVTKGLGDSVKQLAHDTGCGVKIYLDKIPIAPETRAMADEINIDVITSVINGGDDFRLMFIVPLALHEKLKKELPEFDVIGHLCKAEEGTTLVTPEGQSIAITAQGWK